MPSDKKGASHAKVSRIAEFVEQRDWERPDWHDQLLEVLFRLNERNTTVQMEVYAGVIQFISCMYVLPVIPQKMVSAGYDADATFATAALASAIGSILAGLFTNLPFVVAPPTAISIFVALYLEEAGLHKSDGNAAIILSGVALIMFGWRPIGTFFTRLIPSSIQVGTVVGIGLLTALAGVTEIDMITTGSYAVVGLGAVDAEVVLGVAGVIMIAISLHYHLKGAFCVSIGVCTLIWWTYSATWPSAAVELPHFDFSGFGPVSIECIWKAYNMSLAVDLLFLYVLSLSGLVLSLSGLAGLIREDGTTPRNRWIFIICGISTVLSGLMSGTPMLLSPESAGGIKAGARTGLSSIICGICFALSVYFFPILEAIPSAATSPVLIMVGVLLFQNVVRLDWKIVKDAVPAFCILFFIPFTYSVLQGVIVGYIVYLSISTFTGDMFYEASELWNSCCSPIQNESTQGSPSNYNTVNALPPITEENAQIPTDTTAPLLSMDGLDLAVNVHDAGTIHFPSDITSNEYQTVPT
mmetsp:Transcript_20956/g.30211  ORF Transcript_20956/g.30211 Transcript_20956/m.30211 type:complete len:525 (+) Transcript_20956:196-1770(+)|eukprot:CAMPEP_0185036998 /NCGR_PEP_ID=MMETSP1103-20130426/30824_1 /TAXON_ID=36769 /ORGANISM="Paraphysomonas bandaiensis, Strain Caron Lab Isolate" /LENGTH=524 /DNA_ID=CAMNT_0027574789 /DNA_START=124 /DNA_END=1698 /DNA_ORIENTATION=-